MVIVRNYKSLIINPHGRCLTLEKVKVFTNKYVNLAKSLISNLTMAPNNHAMLLLTFAL